MSLHVLIFWYWLFNREEDEADDSPLPVTPRKTRKPATAKRITDGTDEEDVDEALSSEMLESLCWLQLA